MNGKVCNKCKSFKAYAEFGESSRRLDGHVGQCKECEHVRKADWRARNRLAIRAKNNALRLANIDSYRERERRNYQRNPEAAKAATRAYRLRNPTAKYARELKAKYGLSLDDYNRMLAEQGGVCKLCKMPPWGKGKTAKVLHVDHNHETGKVRGLLCMQCNRALGMFSDNPDALISAAMYLVEYEGLRRIYIDLLAA